MKNRRMIVVSGVGIAAAMLGLPADPAHAQVRGTDGLAASAQASGDGVRVTGADPVDMNSPRR